MQTKNSVKLIVDTDIGDDIDDAFALLYLCRHSCVTVEAITTVYKHTAQRAKIAKKLSGGKIPVYAGANRPLEKDVRILLGETVRENGLIDIDHYSVAASNETYEGEDAAGYIVSALRRNPHEITLLAIGPLTNLAQAAMRDKEALRLAKQIVIMGGMFAQNAPEWNIEIDPHAARIVFGTHFGNILHAIFHSPFLECCFCKVKTVSPKWSCLTCKDCFQIFCYKFLLNIVERCHISCQLCKVK